MRGFYKSNPMQGSSRYRIQRQIGQGGMGLVYLAHDEQLDRDVALKFCRAEDRLARRELAKEARAASRLNHPTIAQIYDYGENEESQPFIVMELVEGLTLADLLHAGPLELRETIRVGRSVAEALAEAHRAGIIHRDIKPSNVKLTPRREIKVLDFGIARVNEPLATDDSTATMSTLAGHLKGTPAYMSPEQAQGLPLDPRSDLFSLGSLLYECLTGRRAFDGATLGLAISQIVTVQPPPPSQLNPKVPPAIDRLVMRLLAKQPDGRPASAAEVVAELGNGFGSATFDAPGQPLPSKLPRAGWLALGLLSMIAVGVWFRPTTQISPPARRWYREGLVALQDGAWLKAANLLEKAASLDPSFAPTHARLAQAWLELDYPARAKDEALRASQAQSWLARLSASDVALGEAAQHAVLGEDAQSVGILARRELAASEPEDKAQAALDHGRALERHEKWKDALEAYRRSLEADPQMAGAHVRLARVMAERLKQYPPAQKELDAAQELYRAASNPEGLAEVEYSRALIEIAQSQLAEAEARLRKVIQATEVAGNQQQRVKSSLLLVAVLLNRGDSEEARRIAGEAIETARASGLESLTTRSLIDVGRVLLTKGQLQNAERYLQQALDVSRRTSDRRSEARASLNFSSLRYVQGRLAEALPPLEIALKFYEAGSYQRQLLPAVIILGRVQLGLGHYRESSAAFERALTMAKSGTDPGERGRCEEGLGSVDLERERYREALLHFERAQEAYAQTRNDVLVAYLQNSRAEVLSRLGDFAAAGALFEAAQAVADRENDQGLKSAIIVFRTEELVRRRRWTEAAASARRASTLIDPTDQGLMARVRSARAVAEANLGLTRPATAACEGVAAGESRYGAALHDLNCATVFLLAQQPTQATELARRAAAYFAARDHPESEWMASALAARADPADKSLSATAREKLNHLATLWTVADYQSYLRRPDVVALRLP